MKRTRNLLLAWRSSQQLQHFRKGYSSQKPSKCSLSNHFSVLITEPQVMLRSAKPYNVTNFHFRVTEKNSVYSSKEVIEEADFCGLKYKLSGFPVSWIFFLIELLLSYHIHACKYSQTDRFSFKLNKSIS